MYPASGGYNKMSGFSECPYSEHPYPEHKSAMFLIPKISAARNSLKKLVHQRHLGLKKTGIS